MKTFRQSLINVVSYYYLLDADKVSVFISLACFKELKKTYKDRERELFAVSL